MFVDEEDGCPADVFSIVCDDCDETLRQPRPRVDYLANRL